MAFRPTLFANRFFRSSHLPASPPSLGRSTSAVKAETFIRSASRFRPPPRYNRFSRAQGLYQLYQTRPGFRYGFGITVAGAGVFYYANIETVPVSGRRRFNCVSPQLEQATAEQSLQGVMQQFGNRILPPSHPSSRLVNRVMSRLIPVSGLAEQEWEVRVIDDPEQKNAFVIPGGKVFVFSGILPITQTEDGLAAVLGHEISHNAAHHVAEKMSQAVVLLPLVLGLAFLLNTDTGISRLLLDLIIQRPGSRKQESEADYLGLLMMAQACYDPNAAIGLWQRMSKAEQYAPPQFLSTHPASKNRITTIQGWLPQAVGELEKSGCGNTTSYVDQFRQTSTKSEPEFW